MTNKNKYNLHIVLHLILLLLIILSILYTWEKLTYKEIRIYWNSYDTASDKIISFKSPLFQEINKILFPGYNINKLLENKKIFLREQNEYLTPSLLISNNSIVKPKIPIALLLDLISKKTPDILVLGSSACREAIRPDKFVNTISQLINKKLSLINFCTSLARPETILLLTNTIKNKLKKRIPLILLYVEDWQLNANVASYVKQSSLKYKKALYKKNLNYKNFFPAFYMLQGKNHELNNKHVINSSKKSFTGITIPQEEKPLAYLYENWSIDQKQVLAFSETLSILKELACKVIVLRAPISEWLSKERQRTSSIPFFQNETKKAKLKFLDFPIKSLHLTDTDFYFAKGNAKLDPNHLNPYAAIRYTEFLAKKLKKTIAECK